MFPCPICSQAMRMTDTKQGRIFLRCIPCNINMYVNGDKAIWKARAIGEGEPPPSSEPPNPPEPDNPSSRKSDPEPPAVVVEINKILKRLDGLESSRSPNPAPSVKGVSMKEWIGS